MTKRLSKLETWLIDAVQGGKLRGLPLYYPLGEQVGRIPEQFARTLLADLRDTGGSLGELERTRDDGRAFRSWAESRPIASGNADRLGAAC